MSLGKALGGLLLIYLLIGGSAIWQLRRNCLLQRDSCDYYDLLDWVLTDPISLIASVIFLGLLVFITWQFIALARANKLGIQEDTPEPRFNVSGLLVALIVFALYLGGSLAVLTSAANQLEPLDFDKMDSFFWKSLLTIKGSAIVLVVLWHLNDYFAKPASGITLLLLFGATFGSISWLIKSTLGIP